MDVIRNYFESINLNIHQVLIIAAAMLVGTILLGAIGRFIFGKKSMLAGSISSTIAILFIYMLNIVLYACGVQYHKWITPLPFVTMQDGQLAFLQFAGSHYTAVCAQLLSMVILAFLVNLLDQWIPKGKNFFTWTLFRILTIILAQASHWLVLWLFVRYVPAQIMTYAPIILLGILLLMLVTGALKIIIGALLATANPVIGALYTFFFANLIGKQVTKAVFTTILASLILLSLEHFEIHSISMSLPGLVAYVPLLLLLLLLWFLVIKIF